MPQGLHTDESSKGLQLVRVHRMLVSGALCFWLHTNNIDVQVTAQDQLKAPKVTDASASIHFQPMIMMEWQLIAWLLVLNS